MKKIAILKWGPWLERDVALKSAAYIEDNLGQDFDTYILPEQLEDFLSKRDQYKKVLPIFHWEYWEDGKIQAFLDILDIPYAYSSYSTHAFLLDKYNTNIIARSLWLDVAKDFLIKKKDISKCIPKTLSDITKATQLNYPIIFKPNKWGSSFFTYKVNSDKELEKRLSEAVSKKLNDDILLQNFISWEEYSVPIVNWETLSIMKLEKSEQDIVFDYDSKYENEDLMKETFPEINSDLKNTLNLHTKILWEHFDMRHAVRIDYIVKWDKCYFLDANTIPWMAPASIIPQAWRLSWNTDKEFAEMLCW